MANVMLTSEAAKDPNKPFALRVEDVCAKFDVCATEEDESSWPSVWRLCRPRSSWPSTERKAAVPYGKESQERGPASPDPDSRQACASGGRLSTLSRDRNQRCQWTVAAKKRQTTRQAGLHTVFSSTLGSSRSAKIEQVPTILDAARQMSPNGSDGIDVSLVCASDVVVVVVAVVVGSPTSADVRSASMPWYGSSPSSK
uniref:Uncharacterized protein n=1 Tax=Hyaloperonospora arabidopsidis (strain Emoy2) TaxID=559515 RepID=M4BBU6_HYAAE